MIAKNPQVSVIVAFYNNHLLLEILLCALAGNKGIDFEIIVADDGSELNSRAVAESLLANMNIPYQYIWQEDKGFRKPLILNKAALAARSHRLIFLDGDCVPRAHFVREHLRAAQISRVCAGRRVDLDADLLANLETSAPAMLWELNRYKLFKAALSGRARHLEKLVVSGLLLKRKKNLNRSIVGCNFSIDRNLLLELNGFDCRVNFPWGAEDSDIDRRLKLAGVAVSPLASSATVLHFDTKFSQRYGEVNAGNDVYQEAVLARHIKTPFGIDQLLTSAWD